jgi:hypothetical protein
MKRRLSWLLISASAAGLLGCEPGLSGAGSSGAPVIPPSPTTMPRAGGHFASQADPAGGAQKAKQFRLVVRIRMTAIEVPIGTASGSEEIWSYLDEEPISTIRSVSLGRNGIRVGLGRDGAWPDLAAVFKRMTGQVPSQSVLAAMPNDPLQIILRERQDEATIFTFRDDRTLRGQDYPVGDYLLTVACTLDEDDLSKVMLTAVPQVRSTARLTRFVMSPLGPQMVSQPETYSFSDLTFQLMAPPKGFIVIGPGANARNPATVGYHFLTHKREGVEFETLLVLMPEVLATPIR